MAKPRIFVSSTCYDLKEIRSQIREFILDYGYDPILSEFGDIFFDYGEHPQDSCFKEIEKCQMFVLIIGNSFGSAYYKTTNPSIPSSITMEEFAKSIKCNVPKHVFINRFVDYDYQNYVRAWDKYIRKLRDEDKLSEDNAENRLKVRREFDDAYPFPNDSYRNLFRFIEKIYAENVGVQTFEYSSDIKECLKQQWAGAMYTFLTRDNTISMQEVQNLAQKIDTISTTLRSLLEGKDSKEDKLSFDLTSIRVAQNLSGIEEIKKQVFGYLEEVLMVNGISVVDLQQNASIKLEEVENWLKVLTNNVEIYKWRPYITLKDLFSPFGSKFIIYYGRKDKVNTSLTIDFCMTMKSLKERLTSEDYHSLLVAIHKRFQEIPEDDGLPF